MTQAAKKLLDEFEALPDREREDVLAALLRWAATAAHEGPTDDELVAAADEAFADLDRREKS
jgi:hypothetical protein